MKLKLLILLLLASMGVSAQWPTFGTGQTQVKTGDTSKIRVVGSAVGTYKYLLTEWATKKLVADSLRANRTVYDIRTFGTLSAVSSNTTLFSTAITAVPSGGALYIPEGRWIGNFIITRNDIEIRGAKKPSYNGTTVKGTVIIGGLTMADKSGFELSNIAFDQRTISGSLTNAINIGAADDSFIFNAYIHDVVVVGTAGESDHGILIQGGRNSVIKNCEEYAYNYGIAMRSSFSDISGNYAKDITNYAIIIKAGTIGSTNISTDVNVVNSIDENSYNGVFVFSEGVGQLAQRINISNYTSRNPGMNGFVVGAQSIGDVSSVNVSNMNVYSSGDHAYKFFNGKDISLVNVTAVDATGYSFFNQGNTSVNVNISGVSLNPSTGNNAGTFAKIELSNGYLVNKEIYSDTAQFDAMRDVRIVTSNPGAYPALGIFNGKFSYTRTNLFGLDMGVNQSTGATWLQSHSKTGTPTAYDILLQPSGGKVAIGSQVLPTEMLDVTGKIRASDAPTNPTDVFRRKDRLPLIFNDAVVADSTGWSSTKLDARLPYVTVEQFGSTSDSTVNVSAIFQQAVNAGTVYLKSNTTYLISNINLPANATIIGGFNTVVKTTADTCIFDVTGKNVKLENIILKGNDVGSLQTGVRVVGNVSLTATYRNVTIDNCLFMDFGRSPIYGKYIVGSNVTTRHQGSIIVSNSIFTSSAYGVMLAERSEYNIFTNCKSYQNTYGLWIDGGNNSWTGGTITNNTTGVWINGTGANNGHGVVNGATINHNTTNINVDNTSLGFEFIGCKLAEGAIVVTSSLLTRFVSCEMDQWSLNATSSTITFINNNIKNNPTVLTTTGSTIDWGNNTFASVPITINNIRLKSNITGTQTRGFFEYDGSEFYLNRTGLREKVLTASNSATNVILNQSASPQTADFNITGSGIFGASVSATGIGATTFTAKTTGTTTSAGSVATNSSNEILQKIIFSTAASGSQMGVTRAGRGLIQYTGAVGLAIGTSSATPLTLVSNSNPTAVINSDGTMSFPNLNVTTLLGLDASRKVINAPTVTASQGGTGQAGGYAVGDILYASSATTLSKLADIATGNALLSNGVGVAPSYGKVGLTTHVSGQLPIANLDTAALSLNYIRRNEISSNTGLTQSNRVAKVSDVKAYVDTQIATISSSSGTYTPTASVIYNVASATASQCMYTRVGNIVTVTGKVDYATITASATNTRIDIPLPIASNFASVTDLSGQGSINQTMVTTSVHAEANTSGDVASLFLGSLPISSSGGVYFTFTYTVI